MSCFSESGSVSGKAGAKEAKRCSYACVRDCYVAGAVVVQKFRFCGGLEPPDWLLAELPLLTEKNSNAVRPCPLYQLSPGQSLRAKVTLRFILIHAAKYNAERAELVEELQQLGMEQAAAEAVAQSYEDQRVHIQSQQRAQRFEVRKILVACVKAGVSHVYVFDIV
ncbi:hypothetical protein BBJ28_00005450 [Nothophytophthora sp. Chile5]|nr:hypothetical protein BBJ28_00005450 [Nothophytophthora sp. Chile5]